MHNREDLQHQSNSFLTGFAVGLFAGAAGYYLYATDRGKKLREHLVSEWQTAKVQLVKEGVIDRPDVSLREFIGEVMNKIFSHESSTPDEVETHHLLADNSTGKTIRKKHLPRQQRETAQKFRGV